LSIDRGLRSIRIMKIIWRAKGLAMFCVAVMGLPTFAATPFPEQQALEEVTVVGKRNPFPALRKEMVRLEDQFYERFNALNTDDQYDVHCALEAPLGTRISRRVCRAVFVERANEDEAQAFLRGEMGPPASLTILAKSPDYEKAVLALIKKHPELRRTIAKYNATKARYDKLHKERFSKR
jgi:hypothetical protein